MDGLRDNPILPFAAAALVALLAAFGVYRARQRKKAAELDSAFLESRLQPDSFFGASGGQQVDTSDDENGPASSMSYSPSQLDAAGDVDPVAEADVYLAYGRDLQAEEILKEALRTTPTRVAIHTKLLEIYAKRRDLASFGPLAANAFELTDGEGQDWNRIAQLGRELDPENGLYQTGEHAGSAAAALAGGAALATAHTALSEAMPTESAPLGDPTTAPAPLPMATPGPVAVEPAPATASLSTATDPLDFAPAAPAAPARATPDALDFDLDLDLTHDHLPERAVAAAGLAGGVAAATAAHQAAAPASAAREAAPAPAPAPVPAPAPAPMSADSSASDMGLDFDLDDRGFGADQAATPLTVPAALDLPGQPNDEADGLDFEIDFEPRAAANAPAPSQFPAVQPAFDAPAPTAAPAAPVAAAPSPEPRPLEFDLGSLTLDLGDSTPGGAGADSANAGDEEDPLATKLALAEEFSSIGDEDGARALAEEVLEEATGPLRTRAQRFLSELSS